MITIKNILLFSIALFFSVQALLDLNEKENALQSANLKIYIQFLQ